MDRALCARKSAEKALKSSKKSSNRGKSGYIWSFSALFRGFWAVFDEFIWFVFFGLNERKKTIQNKMFISRFYRGK